MAVTKVSKLGIPGETEEGQLDMCTARTLINRIPGMTSKDSSWRYNTGVGKVLNVWDSSKRKEGAMALGGLSVTA